LGPDISTMQTHHEEKPENLQSIQQTMQPGIKQEGKNQNEQDQENKDRKGQQNKYCIRKN
jgi:hypothetical protein